MNKNELQQIIAELEESNSKDEAYFGIFQYGGGPEESFVKANRQGLELFAADLLKASRDAKSIVDDKDKTIYTLDFQEPWIDKNAHTFIQYIEPSIESRKHVEHELYNETWKDKLIKVGCIAGVILIAGVGIVGVVTVVGWLMS